MNGRDSSDRRTILSSKETVEKDDGRYIIFYSFDADDVQEDRESPNGLVSEKGDSE